jgi:YceI-like domain
MSTEPAETTRHALVVVLLAVVVACGCVPQPMRPPSDAVAPSAISSPAGERPETFDEQVYQRAYAQGQPIYRVDPTASIVVVEVRRAGSLARLGHDHVVASHDVHGYVAPIMRRADLYLRLDRLVVDEPALRKEAGFDTNPSPDAIAGTRRNMLERTLEVERYPFASIGVRIAEASSADPRRDGDPAPLRSQMDVDVAITLHGTARTFRIPLQRQIDEAMIAVTGQIALKQSDFGIAPLSILGGSIQVQDQLALRFHIEARRVPGFA